MQTDWAGENLQVIRTLMERASLYRRALAPIMLTLGALGLAGGVLGHLLDWNNNARFVGFWFAFAVLALAAAFLLARRQALKAEEPFWSPAGDELFYRFGSRFMSVRYRADEEFHHEAPEVAFEGRFENVPGISYQVSADGQRLLALKFVFDDTQLSKIHIVLNWFAELKKSTGPRP